MSDLSDRAHPPRPRHLRAADSDRESAAEVLQQAFADGRLDVDELGERLNRVWSAKTYGEIDDQLADLPVPQTSRLPEAASDMMTLTAGLSDRKQMGSWVAPPTIVAQAGGGSVKIDFTDAVVRHPSVHVEASAVLGSVVLLVPPGWTADVSGVASGMGSVRNKASGPGEACKAHLVVTGLAGGGDAVVRYPRTTRLLPR